MLNLNVHRQIMLRFLKDLYSDSSLGSLLGFKGGTAAYLLYGLPRFSVDLDFDLLNPAKGQFVFEKISKLLAKFGNLTEADQKRFTLFYQLSYSTGLQKLKVEVSRRPFNSTYKKMSHLGIPLLIMAKPDMFAHKLVALTERKQTANRDLFDIYFFLKENWQVNIKIVETRTDLPYRRYIENCITLIERRAAPSLLANLGELVDNKTKFWIKNKLKPELLTLLKIHSDSIVV